MTFKFGKTYSIAGLDGLWRVAELEYNKRTNFISVIRFSRADGKDKRVVRNIDEKDLKLSVRESKQQVTA